jgi:hypothetical protein
MKKYKLFQYLTWFSRIFLLIFNSFWFVFALLSGSEEYGGGLKGIIRNSPNSLPWFLFFALIYLAWKKELIGGVLISTLGIITILAFHTYKNIITFSIISLPLIITGILLIISYFLKKKALQDLK